MSLPEGTQREVAETIRKAKEAGRDPVPAIRRAIETAALKPPASFAEFAERTTGITLDPWQHDLCRRLERLRTETGVRLLIHAAPQHGKSILVSQRLPAWILGHDPECMVRLACYNVTHAESFGKVVLNLMRSDDYIACFPTKDCRVPAIAPAGNWSTAARERMLDTNPSFKALGLQSGWVGAGCKLLICDDPYGSPQDAASEIVRNSVWQFWEEGARPRLTPDSNAVVMFHRYNHLDFAGELLRQGGWEYVRYAAEADEDPEWPDPMGRKPGEFLSPRYPPEFYEAQKKSGWVWLGQFQGRPTPKEGLLFKADQIGTLETVPSDLDVIRAWDLAATQGAGDWTVGVKLGISPEGGYYILHVRRGQWEPNERNRVIKETAKADGADITQYFAIDPAQAGKDQALNLTRLLDGYNVVTEHVTGDKETRAEGLAAQVNGGNVWMRSGEWNPAFRDELRQFPRGTHDDQVDAASYGRNYLSRDLVIDKFW